MQKICSVICFSGLSKFPHFTFNFLHQILINLLEINPCWIRSVAYRLQTFQKFPRNRKRKGRWEVPLNIKLMSLEMQRLVQINNSENYNCACQHCKCHLFFTQNWCHECKKSRSFVYYELLWIEGQRLRETNVKMEEALLRETLILPIWLKSEFE